MLLYIFLSVVIIFEGTFSEENIQSTLKPIVTTTEYNNVSITKSYNDNSCSDMWKPPKRDDNPCIRQCHKGDNRDCYYNFTVEMYSSMSKACYDCPAKLRDCYRKDCIPVDGNPKFVYSVNRQIPGPTIEVCHGDMIHVRVENVMNDAATTIHWHGITQEGSPYMDGVPMITQCPIPPGTTFTYRFRANDSGTHFWHAHIGMQRVDGVFGAIIVKQPESEIIHEYLYDVDENVMVLNDWSHIEGSDKLMAYLHRGGSNTPDTILCNGKGRYYKDGTQVTDTPLEVFHVEKDKRYRFRAINSGAYDCPIAVSIDNHIIVAVASDGTEFQPVYVDSLVIFAGERFDFIVNANQTIGNYWIRFKGLVSCENTLAHNVAILHYSGADCTEPESPVIYNGTNIPPTKELNSVNVPRYDKGHISVADLIVPPSWPINDNDLLRDHVDQKIVLPFDFKKVDNPIPHRPPYYGVEQVKANLVCHTPQLQHMSLQTPNAPPLSQPCDVNPKILCTAMNGTNCVRDYCQCLNVKEVKLGSLVELILIDEGKLFNANHPFHLHGHSFRVVAMDKVGNSTTEDQVMNLDKRGLIKRNLVDAPYKDTVTVPRGGYTILRFRSNNPGMWLFHCHLEFHIEMKMAVLFKVGSIKDFPEVPPDFPICGRNFNSENLRMTKSCTFS